MMDGWRCAAVAWTVALLSAGLPAKGADLRTLRTGADRVLTLGTVEARGRIGVVFEYARALAASGKIPAALGYYERGLRVFAMSLPHQVEYAELLAKAKRPEEAIRRARIVLKIAEDGRLLRRAEAVAGRKPPKPVEKMAAVAPGEPTLVLVPLGKHDLLVLRELQGRLKKALGIDVLLRKLPLTVSPHGRDHLEEFATTVRERFLAAVRARDPNELKALLKNSGMTEEDLEDPETLVDFVGDLLRKDGKRMQARSFEAAAARARRQGRQWEAQALLSALRTAARPYRHPKARFLAVTRQGLFAEGCSFLFGYRWDEYAVVSYRRFGAAFTGEAPNRTRLLRRLTNQALSSTGHMFRLARCSDPTCPRAYPHSLGEHDVKSDRLCPVCRAAFSKVFGHQPAAGAGANNPRSRK